MPIKVCVLAFGLVAIASGCKSVDNNVPTNTSSAPAASSPATVASPSAPSSSNDSTVKGKVDVCKLLTPEDLKEVQGEPFKEALRSDRRDGSFIVAQCYFSLPTTVNSVVLNVTTANEEGVAGNPRTFWKNTFGRNDEKVKERERERKGKELEAKPQKGEIKEESNPPVRISGLGDEAYWIASRVGGALYVLKKDLFFRISVGGAGDEKSKLNKSKILARRVLNRI